MLLYPSPLGSPAGPPPQEPTHHHRDYCTWNTEVAEQISSSRLRDDAGPSSTIRQWPRTLPITFENRAVGAPAESGGSAVASCTWSWPFSALPPQSSLCW